MKKLKIAQIAPLWVPVPPLTYGGTELIVSLLTEALLERGHNLTLFSTEDSETNAELIPVWEKSLWRARLSSPHAVFGIMYKKILEMQEKFDVFHNHTGFYLNHITDFIKRPILSTIHRPITEETLKLFELFPNINYVAISEDQRKSAPSINFKAVIYNGIPVENYDFNNDPDDYVLWFSKLIPEKGVLDAINAAKIAKTRLIIAGNILPESERFFRYEVLPQLDDDQISYVGQADFPRKVELMKNAKAMLYPISRREPFGLAVIEAMACGTPVIGYPNGAVPELITDGDNGFIVKNPIEMAVAINQVDNITRSNCRHSVRRKFSLQKMVDAYEEAYRTLV